MWTSRSTAQLAWLALLGVCALADGCSDHNDGPNFYNGYRVGARCSSLHTCPPGQVCDSGRICRQPCKNPFGQCIAGQPCECPSGLCDLDLLCRPSCGTAQGSSPTCGFSMPGGKSNCGDSAVCDTATNVCRSLCSGGCSDSEICVTPGDTCPFCRPKGSFDGGVDGPGGPDAPAKDGGPPDASCGSPDAGSGMPGASCPSGVCPGACLACAPGEAICRRPCSKPGKCFSASCECNHNPAYGQIEECDRDLFCRPACGMGSSFCGPIPSCPPGLVCDTDYGVCRQECTGTCPPGMGCIPAPGGTCNVCRPGTGPSSDGGAGCPPAMGNEVGVGKPCSKGGGECMGNMMATTCSCDLPSAPTSPCYCTKFGTGACPADPMCGGSASCCSVSVMATTFFACIPTPCLSGGSCP